MHTIFNWAYIYGTDSSDRWHTDICPWSEVPITTIWLKLHSYYNSFFDQSSSQIARFLYKKILSTTDILFQNFRCEKRLKKNIQIQLNFLQAFFWEGPWLGIGQRLPDPGFADSNPGRDPSRYTSVLILKFKFIRYFCHDRKTESESEWNESWTKLYYVYLMCFKRRVVKSRQ